LLVFLIFTSVLNPAEPYQPPEAVAPEIYVQPAAPVNPQLPAESYATEIVLGTGDVQITLRWNSDADLDLHVIDPYQEELWYGHSFAQSGGELDVDANAGCASTMPSPVENVFWQFGGAPGGAYKVNVVYFMNCIYSGPVEYEVVIRLDGNIYGTYPGTIYEAGDVQFITEFSR